MAESPRNVDGLGLEGLKSLLVQVLEDNARLTAEVAALRDENARLKGLKGRPRIKPGKPSGMEKATEPEGKRARKIGRRGAKRSKLTITETKVVKVANEPADARFKGYEDFVVQDLNVQSTTVLYRRERWQLADGSTVVAPLPAGITSHFGPELKRFVLASCRRRAGHDGGEASATRCRGTASMGSSIATSPMPVSHTHGRRRTSASDTRGRSQVA